jgi:ABC-type nickel/cobalt efflux system permease component RcnA
MKLEYTKAAFAAVWVLATLAVAYASNVTSVSGWVALASLALLPPIAAWRLWRHPRQSISQSIHEARR